MIGRRSFLGFLAALPIVGGVGSLFKPTPVTTSALVGMPSFDIAGNVTIDGVVTADKLMVGSLSSMDASFSVDFEAGRITAPEDGEET